MARKTNVKKQKILFVFDMPDESRWMDGLWAALVDLDTEKFVVIKHNLAHHSGKLPPKITADFVLGWGGFNSSVDNLLQSLDKPKGLCLGGYGFPAIGANNYDVIFYECEWARQWLLNQGVNTRLVHAFGVNTEIFRPNYQALPIWSYITVGTFSAWKRQDLLLKKTGPKIAVGAIQLDNMEESIDIVGKLVLGHCAVSDELPARTLAGLYQTSAICYIPADILGGGERAILEARACGTNVEVEKDNPKLKELTECPIWDHKYYSEQLEGGIQSCLNAN